MANCSKCSQTLPDDSRFCIHCGEPVVVAPPVVTTCPRCQAQLPEGSRFCVACGHDLKSPPPPAVATMAPDPTGAPASLAPPVPVTVVSPSVVAPKSGPSVRVILAIVTALALLTVAAYSYRAGVAPPSTPPAISSPTPSATLEAVDLQALADTWSVDPADPSYTAGSKEQNELLLQLQGQEVLGTGPDRSPFRFWAEGEHIVGEARDPQGQLHKLRWEWLDSGRKARLHLLGENDKTTLTLRRGPAAEPPPPETSVPVLYELQADLNGDGKQERAEVVALDRNPEPNAASRKVLRIYDQAGARKFESEPFEEPFHTDLDSSAEHVEEKAGMHLVPARRFPRLRLIFTTRSGNFVDFQFDGRQYVLAEIGD